MTFDVSVRDGRLQGGDKRSRVWILSHFARLPLRVQLHLRGTGAVPEPEGQLTALAVRLFYLLPSYRVEYANLIFPPNAPFEPRIEANLRTRMVSYDVRLQVSGLLSDPRVSVSILHHCQRTRPYYWRVRG